MTVPSADTSGDKVPVFLPHLDASARAAVDRALDIGYLGLGPTTGLFEQRLGEWLGLEDRRVTATSSCTSALHLAAMLAGAGPGTEVITPSLTYVAAHQAMTMTGTDVVFADVDDKTLSIDPARVRELITDRTVAIMTCHYAGHVGDVEGLYDVAREAGVRVIEDAAHALGSLLPDDRYVGTSGDLVAFSFGPVKTITTLEGGALVTSDPEELEMSRERRLLGADMDLETRSHQARFWEYDVVRQGYRYHLGAVPASLGLSQLEQLDGFLARRRAYCHGYDEAFADVPEIRTMAWDWSRTGPYVYVVRVDADSRDALIASLGDRGVSANVHWGQGVHAFSHYAGARRDDLANTELATRELVTLPLWSTMPERARERVIEGVRAFYGA